MEDSTRRLQLGGVLLYSGTEDLAVSFLKSVLNKNGQHSKAVSDQNPLKLLVWLQMTLRMWVLTLISALSIRRPSSTFNFFPGTVSHTFGTRGSSGSGPRGDHGSSRGAGSTSPLHLLPSLLFPFPGRVRLFVTPWTVARQASLSFTISQSLLKFMSAESVMPFNCHILCFPLVLLPSSFPAY